jgi:large subunit ribosomal protein L23
VRVYAHQDIVLRPVVTEKTLARSERLNSYTFEVKDAANKIQIRDAVQRLFKVTVTGVRTQRCHGKMRRLGRWLGSTGDWKKAVVRVKQGQTIEFV